MIAATDMARLCAVLASLAAIAQLTAARFALGLGDALDSTRVWRMVAAGLLLAAGQRVLVAYAAGAGGGAGSGDVLGSSLALGGSVVLAIGLARAAWSRPRTTPEAAQPEAGEASPPFAERLETLFRAAPDSLLLCGSDGVVVDANDAAVDLYGLPRGKLLGAALSTLLPRSPRSGDAAATGDREESFVSGMREVRCADGSDMWLDVRAERLDLSDEALMLVSARSATERRRLEDQLLGQEARVAFIVDHLPAVLWTTDDTLRVTSARGKVLEWLGLSPSAEVGRPLGEILTTRGGDEQVIAWHRQALAGETVTFHHEFGDRVFEGVMTSTGGEDLPLEVVGIALDVTDTASAESEARATELRLHEILDHAPVMILIKDLDLRVTYANEEWEKVTGMTLEGVLGRSALEVLPAAVAAEVEANDREVLAIGEARTFIEKIGRSARERSFEMVKFPLHDSRGSVYAVCAMMREITAQAAMGEELRRRATLLDEAQTMAGLGIWEWDVVNDRRYWSPQLFALLGLDPASGAQAAYEAYLAAVPEDDRELLSSVLAVGMSEGLTYRVEHRVHRSDGLLRWLRIRGRIDRSDKGTPLRAYGFAQDITAERAASDEIARLNQSLEERVVRRTTELEYARKELSTFSYAVSHDLRQPLRAIAGYLALLVEEDGTALPQPTRESLDRVQLAVRRMDATIDALLALTRLTRATVHLGEIDATAMAREVAAELAVADAARVVEWDIQPGVTVIADPGLFRIVLQNLLGNAFKFTRGVNAARIAFACEPGTDGGVLFVRDNGAGFESSSARRLFQPFQRMHDARDFEGTGIGLATVARILERHGGWIRAESTTGAGATFRFSPGAAAGTASRDE